MGCCCGFCVSLHVGVVGVVIISVVVVVSAGQGKIPFDLNGVAKVSTQ